MKSIIIGNSAAGISAAFTLRFLKPEDEITILSKENELGYSPSLIAHYIGGEIPYEKVVLYHRKWYQEQAIDLRLNHRVVRLVPKKKQVLCEQGQKINYNKLLIASGAAPLFPFPFDTSLPGVCGVRTIEDGRKIKKRVSSKKKAVVVGAGFIGLKIASCLRKKQMEVSLVETAPQIMGNLADEEASQRIARHFNSQGIKIYFNTQINSLEMKKNRYHLKLTDGNCLEANLIIVSIGVVPNRDFLNDTPLLAKEAISVNKFQETELPDIYAAGDVCLSQNIQTGKEIYNPIWPNAVRQGKVAAFSMAGFKATFPGTIIMNSGEFLDMWVNIVGTTEGAKGEIKSFMFSNEKWYQRLYTKGKHILKYISVGNVDYTGIIAGAIRNRVSIDELARSYPATQIPVVSEYRRKG